MFYLSITANPTVNYKRVWASQFKISKCPILIWQLFDILKQNGQVVFLQVNLDEVIILLKSNSAILNSSLHST